VKFAFEIIELLRAVDVIHQDVLIYVLGSMHKITQRSIIRVGFNDRLMPVVVVMRFLVRAVTMPTDASYTTPEGIVKVAFVITAAKRDAICHITVVRYAILVAIARWAMRQLAGVANTVTVAIRYCWASRSAGIAARRR